MVQFALFAILSLGGQAPATDVDVWFCPNIEVTAHTNLDHSPAPAAYDIRDAFGGTYGNVPHEGGHIVFEDESGGPGQPDFIDWNTKSLVEINRLVMSWQDDSPGRDWRNMAHFWIYAKKFADEQWKVIWQGDTPARVGRHTVTTNVTPGQYQFFRAEFVRGGATDASAVAPRICALEAYGHAIQP